MELSRYTVNPVSRDFEPLVQVYKATYVYLGVSSNVENLLIVKYYKIGIIHAFVNPVSREIKILVKIYKALQGNIHMYDLFGRTQQCRKFSWSRNTLKNRNFTFIEFKVLLEKKSAMPGTYLVSK